MWFEFCSIFAPENQTEQMNRILIIATVCVVAFLAAVNVAAQDNGYDVFNPIAKYLAKGDADKLEGWFTRTRKIRRSIIDEGQDDPAPDFGRRHGKE